MCRNTAISKLVSSGIHYRARRQTLTGLERIMMGASYKTKKDLKAAVGKHLRYIETSMFGQNIVAMDHSVLSGRVLTLAENGMQL